MKHRRPGGHNAPPRGKGTLNARGEPVYGPRDRVDLAAIKALGVPFWMAGSYASPKRLAEALAAGASGVQVGSLFAFCAESGLRQDLKRRAIQQARDGDATVFKDPVASPTGYPFQVLSMPGTLSEGTVYDRRERVCDLGYLREAYVKPGGGLGWRCPAEPVDQYTTKGGTAEEAEGRKCLCNGLMANIGLAQLRAGTGEEPPLLTCGEDLACVGLLADDPDNPYTAEQVVRHLLPA